MRPDQWERVKQLFHEVLARPAEHRHTWLVEASAGDDRVIAEVERLVAAHLAAGSFIETPVTDLHAERPRSRTPKSGSWMGQYRLDALLGVGGMGEVYQAIDAVLGRTVAIKIVSEDEAAAHERLRREARHASALNHPNICTIHHVGDHDRRPFIVMEFVDGHSLSDTIPPSGLPVAVVTDYAGQILDALAHAHAHGVVHRDLKSANVMVKPTGQVKLLDFGLAKRVDGVAPIAPAAVPGSTDRTVMGGTLPYMAPEMLRGQPADARTDLWAFGVLLYEMCTGRLPFTGRSTFEMTSAILNVDPAPVPPTVHPSLAAAIRGCLQKDPENRYQDAADVKRGLADAVRSPRPTPVHRLSRRATPALVVVAVALLVAIALVGPYWRRATAAPVRAIHALAVLPLENLSPGAAEDYFADGITEALITDLGKMRDLRVISRTTSMRFRGARKSLSEVAKELKVDALVEGAVQHDGNNVRVIARLFGSSDQQLWTGTYERPVRDVLVLQRDIVRAIADRVGVSLTVQDDRRLSLVRSVDPDAYEAYLKGRYYWNKRTPESLSTAVQEFHAATKADPTYAPGYVGLADCYNQMGTVMVAQASPAKMRPLANAAAIAALQIDPTLGEGHAALAYTLHYDWQWEPAGREFRRAIELSPNNALAHIWYANYLASLMRLDEAVVQVQIARQLDPLSLVVQTNVGWTMGYARRVEEAIAAYREALRLDANYVQAHARLGSIYASIGRFDEAVAEHETVLRLSRGSTSSLVGLAITYAEVGRRREAERLLADILLAARRQYIPPFALAQVYVKLGNADRTFECLERAYEERSNGRVYLNVDDVFAAVRDDPRYRDLLRRVGLAQ